MSAHDESLVAEVLEVADAALTWDPYVEGLDDAVAIAILDRLLELGWRPPPDRLPRSIESDGTTDTGHGGAHGAGPGRRKARTFVGRAAH